MILDAEFVIIQLKTSTFEQHLTSPRICRIKLVILSCHKRLCVSSVNPHDCGLACYYITLLCMAVLYTLVLSWLNLLLELFEVFHLDIVSYFRSMVSTETKCMTFYLH